MPNLKKSDCDSNNVDQSFTAFKKDDVQAVYKTKLDGEKTYERWRVISKVLTLNKNNQYGFAVTKPMPTGSIKEHLSPSWKKFNLQLESVSLNDKIGQRFVVDTEFDKKKATSRESLNNEILPPVIEKEKILDANEKPIYQLRSIPKHWKRSSKDVSTYKKITRDIIS